MSLSPFLILTPYLLSALLSLLIGVYAWQRAIPGARLFAGVGFFETIWTTGYVLQLLMPGLSAMLFWNNVQFLGAIGAPLVYLGFALEYDRPTRGVLSRCSWKAFIPLSVLVLAFVWTDGLHGLFRGQSQIVPGEPFSHLVFPNGSWFVVYPIYAYSLLVLTTVILISRYLSAEKLYRIQIGIVLIGVLIPWITTLLTYMELVPVKLHDVTPLTFGISNLIIAWALFRYHLFETVPVARDFLVENMSEGVLVLDDMLRVVDINPAAQKIMSTRKVVALGKNIQSFSLFERNMFICLNKGDTNKYEILVESGDLPGIYELQVTRLEYPRGETSIYLAILRDIHDRKKFEERLNHLAITDSLTRIYNRRHVLACAGQEISYAIQSGYPLSLIIFDIDHFKQVNDTYGHQVGDQVLERLTTACQAALRNRDIFGRYGGEEFLVVLPETDADTAAGVAERLRLQVEELSVVIHGEAVRVTLSLGVASMAHQTEVDLDHLLERADQALYRAKAAGRNCVARSVPPENQTP